MELDVIAEDPGLTRCRLRRARGFNNRPSLARKNQSGLPLKLHIVGSANCLEKFGMSVLGEDLNVGHYTMTANDPWKELDAGKIRYLLIEGDDFVIICT